jgi:cytochrome P450
LDRLRRDPRLAPTAVEELVRFTAPVFLCTGRYAHEDVPIWGVTIPRGG